ncbi:cathepsin L-like protease [Echinococcus multilocularis]|uniref:Cathepsin L-like protease n=1 Tax=Echinococcus multilocularis TaxID=6211 RepID=A0A0S4MM49_ECHMU|nr:cathepsin L-like protease [Echinococcus multilocularis]
MNGVGAQARVEERGKEVGCDPPIHSFARHRHIYSGQLHRLPNSPLPPSSERTKSTEITQPSTEPTLLPSHRIALTIPTRIITSRPLTFLTPPHLNYPQYQSWRLASGATMRPKEQKNMAERRRVVTMQVSATTTKNERVNGGPQQGRGIRSLTHWWTMLSSGVE